MRKSRLFFSLSVVLILFASIEAHSTYNTPGTGVIWNLDSLVARSSGALTGTFPNYTVNDEIGITANDRLNILPGSILTVTQGTSKGFTVFGVLRAIGTPLDSIIVKGSVDSAGWYRGFRFDDTSVDSLCVVSYCKISNATDGVYCFNANTTITNSLFTRNSSNGVRCSGASPIIHNCTFTENRQSAITANLSSSPVIESSFFIRNNSQNTGARNQIAIGGQGSNNPIIRNNEIYNQSYFRAGGISLLTLASSDVCNAIVENNYIHDNSFGIVVQGLSAGGTLRPLLRYNRIENNRINPDPMVSGSGITVQTGGPTNAPIITGNILRKNYWGVTCVSASGLTNSPQPNLGNTSNADTSDDGWNIFENNNNGGVIYQLYNNGSANIFAQNNYWGSGDSATVESWIVHQPDSSVFGFVQYRPYGNRGFGRPASFTIRQQTDSLVRLQWRFASTSQSGGIRILKGNDSLHLSLVAELAASETSFVTRSPIGLRQYFGLASFNRFGTGDTTTKSFGGSDTSLLRYFPTHIGNKWQYYVTQIYPEPPDTTFYQTVRITGDTLMPNGRRYKVFTGLPFPYLRIDTLALRVIGYKPFGACRDSEDVLFRLSLDSMTYHNCRGTTIGVDTGRGPIMPGGVSARFQSHHWYELVSHNFKLSEGIGTTFYSLQELGGENHTLVAALINGVQYGTFVGVDERQSSIPSTFQLSQNYPNPFNPSTNISFELPVSSLVSLKVFDLLGREVVSVVNERLEAGRYSKNLDASGLTSGVYFYRLQAGGYVAARKLLLLR